MDAAKKASFEAAFAAELPLLYRVARRLAGNETEAEDIVSNAMLNAYKAWERFDGRHVRSWLVRIVQNEFYAQRRRPAARQSVALDAVAEPADETFWQDIDWTLVGGDVLREVEKLPEEYRLAVVLCDAEGLSYEEAAMAMDVPVGTVRSRLSRGRNLLRSRLVRLGHELGYSPKEEVNP